MNKYAVFAGYNYYPSGGWNDFVGFCETLDQAYKLVLHTKGDWYEIVEIQQNLIISKGNKK